MLLLILLPLVSGRGPPGMRPPSSFVAESWYPSNLPTVKPPWKQPGVDINLFRTQEFSDNSVTAPMEDEVTVGPLKTTKSGESFLEDNITEILVNATESSKEMQEEGSGEENVANTTVITTIASILVENTTKMDEEDSKIPFKSGEEIFDIEKKNDKVEKTRGEGKIKERKESTQNSSACSDLIFVIDSSGNVISQYEKQKELVRHILISIGPSRRKLGLITYAGRRKQRWNISPRHNVSRDLYLKKLKKARFLGGVTATGSVLGFLAKETVDSRSTIVLLTDGFSFDEVDEAAKAIRKQSNFTEIYVTGDYFPIVRPVLNTITGSPEHVFLGHSQVKRLIDLLKC